MRRSAVLLLPLLIAAAPARHAPASLPAVADIGAPPQGRLPEDAIPSAYRIDLTVLPEQPRFTGHVEIDVTLPAPRTAIWINGRDLHVTHVETRTAGGIVATRYAQVDRLGVARLDFATALPVGKVTLVFDYDAAFASTDAALFHTQVGGDWCAWSQFESIDARGAFPGFDQPGYKTPFAITLTTHAGEVVTSNAPETRSEHAGALVRHVFAPTLPLPTYLVQFGVGPFAVASGAVPPSPERKAPLPLRIVATGNNADKLDYALKETPRILALLEDYFGSAFPFPKLDQIASPIMEGAMENAGADTYEDDFLLLDPRASTEQRQRFGEVVAHELSHQWFGDLVTPAWWDDIWLNESFADWMGYRIGNAWRPELNIGVGAIGEALKAMDVDSLAAGRPIHQPIARSGDIDSAFDDVTYGKGGQVIAMIAAYLGDATFRDGVRLHLSRHAYGNATSENFFKALADAAHDPRIVAAMRSFVDQQGVPVVAIAHAPGGGLIATQQRYALLGGQAAAERWTIPLCLRRGAERVCTLLDKPSMPIALPGGDGPLMPNAGGTGYYRFALSDADWQALIAGAAQLPPGEALAATDSLWAGFRAGEIAPMRLIAMARAMVANPNAAAALDAATRLADLRTFGLVHADALPAYRRLVDAIYAPTLAKLGSDLRVGAYAGDPPDRQKLRATLVGTVAVEARDAALRARLLTAARAYVGGDLQALDPAVLGAALRVYLEEGGLPAAQTLLRTLAASSDELFRGIAERTLAQGGDPAEARWLLGMFDDNGFRPTEKIQMLTDMSREPAVRDVAIAYLDAHFDALAKDTGIFAFGRLVTMPDHYCSIAKANQIEATAGPRVARYQRAALDLARTVEKVRSCGALDAARGADLAAALAKG